MSEQYQPKHAAVPVPQDPGVTDPSALGGNATQPAIEFYDKKVEFLAGMFQERTTANVTEAVTNLVGRNGGWRAAESKDFWEGVKGPQAHQAGEDVSSLLFADKESWSKPDEEKDTFDHIATLVAFDRFGSIDPAQHMRGHDVTDFNVGAQIGKLAESGELSDPAVLAKATKTIRLLVAQGLYKFNAWGNGDQLKTALEVMEACTKHVRDFNPIEAGLEGAQDGLILARAALDIDQKSKPNYQYAKPERNHLFRTIASGFTELNTVMAHLFLRERDFVLPSAEQQPAPQ